MFKCISKKYAKRSTDIHGYISMFIICIYIYNMHIYALQMEHLVDPRGLIGHISPCVAHNFEGIPCLNLSRGPLHPFSHRLQHLHQERDTGITNSLWRYRMITLHGVVNPMLNLPLGHSFCMFSVSSSDKRMGWSIHTTLYLAFSSNKARGGLA